MTELYPLRLSNVTKAPIWSGGKLSGEWKKGEGAIGESWELCVRENENSIVENGTLRGRTLAELIDTYGAALTGSDLSSDEFPLLIKLIDAGGDLSVQVHPGDDYAARVENDRGKTEMWYIVDAEEGARIVCGLRAGVGKGELAEAVKSGKTENVLNYVPVRAGETYFIPAGLPHAIGRGILIAEIQQNCDLTYRLYDYGRVGADGKARELHIDKALDVIRDFSDREIRDIRYSRAHGETDDGLLVDCEYFRVSHLRVEGAAQLPKSKKMRHLLVISGEGEMSTGKAVCKLEKGSSYLLPACVEVLDLNGRLEALLTD